MTNSVDYLLLKILSYFRKSRFDQTHANQQTCMSEKSTIEVIVTSQGH